MDQRSKRRTSAARYGYQPPKKQNDFLHVLLFYILPFLVVNGLLFFFVTTSPKVTITVAPTQDYETSTASIEIKSVLPLKAISVTQESAPLELTKTESGVYTVPLTKNGVIEVMVASLNGMVSNAYAPVDVLDELPPSILEDFTIVENVLTFTVEDSQSGVDFDSITAVTPMGTAVSPISVDKTSGQVSFEMDETGLTIHVSDLCGNTTQASFNPSGREAAPEETQESGVSIVQE